MCKLSSVPNTKTPVSDITTSDFKSNRTAANLNGSFLLTRLVKSYHACFCESASHNSTSKDHFVWIWRKVDEKQDHDGKRCVWRKLVLHRCQTVPDSCSSMEGITSEDPHKQTNPNVNI